MSTISGSFSSEGQPIGNTSSSAEHKGAGSYAVTFNTPFPSVPAVVVSPQTDNIGSGYVVSTSLGSVSKTGFSVYFQDLSNPPKNLDVSFSFFAAPCI